MLMVSTMATKQLPAASMLMVTSCAAPANTNSDRPMPCLGVRPEFTAMEPSSSRQGNTAKHKGSMCTAPRQKREGFISYYANNRGKKNVTQKAKTEALAKPIFYRPRGQIQCYCFASRAVL